MRWVKIQLDDLYGKLMHSLNIFIGIDHISDNGTDFFSVGFGIVVIVFWAVRQSKEGYLVKS